MIKIIKRDDDKNGPVFPSQVNNKRPAIIFTANCTVDIPGRIIFLIVSIYTNIRTLVNRC